MIRDRGFLRDLLQKAAAFGCETLFFTVDMPAPAPAIAITAPGLLVCRSSRATCGA